MDENRTVSVNANGTDPADSATNQKLTFDELLKDPEYQAEFDRKVAKSTEKARAKWQKEADEKRTEAENLARMSEEEKYKYQIDKLTKERDGFEARLNAFELKNEAQKIASEKGLDISVLDIIDFTKENAESVKGKIDLIAKYVTASTEKQLSERLKQPSPNNVEKTNDKKKEVKRASF